MSTERFTPGQVVRLKSGGPKMTVIHHPKDAVVTCVWFPGFDYSAFPGSTFAASGSPLETTFVAETLAPVIKDDEE